MRIGLHPWLNKAEWLFIVLNTLLHRHCWITSHLKVCSCGFTLLSSFHFDATICFSHLIKYLNDSAYCSRAQMTRVVHFCRFCATEIPWRLHLCEKTGDEDEEDANVHGPSSTTGFGVPTPDQTSCREDLLKNSRNITESPL